MKTELTELFGIKYPIFAFCHSPEVVVEVSKNGGMGIFGCAGYSKETLEKHLKWINDNVDGKPYGVNLLMPAKVAHGIIGEKNAGL